MACIQVSRKSQFFAKNKSQEISGARDQNTEIMVGCKNLIIEENEGCF